ncbi:uncharacterized protein RCC_05979 [Ramularia collo-cygni]|uniref:SnoaL-like domain-containing protein n=1 Tax=Ramularia collo-cygni TaxID=112498 RepID=A0A2D3US64_9PEZI|nr:uncharacterized protein RCC_05979 [Ramularia collo-cygni]CZT20122.1 uncharacterized protein RCC_05979 [Ramularia collo-cygni]
MDLLNDDTFPPLLEQPFRTPKGAETLNIESFLVILTAAIMEDHSTSTYSIMQTHCHPDLKIADFTKHECLFPRTESLRQYLSQIDDLKHNSPNLRFNPFNFSVTFDQDCPDRAIVWFTLPGIEKTGDERESVHRVHWRRREDDDVWEAYMHSALRGPGTLFLQSTDSIREAEDVPVDYLPTKKFYTANELKS